MKKLIEGSSCTVQPKFEQLKSTFGQFKKVTVFFENANFLATDFFPMTPNVHMILVDEFENELHIEGCNCGYGGEGPNTSVRLLTSIGIRKELVEDLIFYNNALQFQLTNATDGRIYISNLNKSCYFTTETKSSSYINVYDNINIELIKRKIMLFNPQYHSFVGLLKFLNQIEPRSFEYYIGSNSPLENFFRVDEIESNPLLPPKYDLTGINHVNLVVKGKNVTVSCLIDKQCELQIIDSIYLSLEHTSLFSSERYQLEIKKKNSLFMLFKSIVSQKDKMELHDSILLNKGDE